jgi:hypothetical protein
LPLVSKTKLIVWPVAWWLALLVGFWLPADPCNNQPSRKSKTRQENKTMDNTVINYLPDGSLVCWCVHAKTNQPTNQTNAAGEQDKVDWWASWLVVNVGWLVVGWFQMTWFGLEGWLVGWEGWFGLVGKGGWLVGWLVGWWAGWLVGWLASLPLQIKDSTST